MNALLAYVSLALLGLAMARLLVAPPNRLWFLGYYSVAIYAFPWTHDLFVHPSLQEKWVLMAGAISLLWFGKLQPHRSSLRQWLTGLFLLTIGFLTKAQFLMFVPGVLLVAYVRLQPVGRKALLLLSGWLLYAVAWVLLIKHISSRGSYTARFGMTHIIGNLGALSVGLMAVAFTFGLMAWRQREAERGRTWLLHLLPSLFILNYLAIFLQWTVSGYLLSVIGFAVASIFAEAACSLRLTRRLRTLAVSCTILACVFISTYRGVIFFGTLHSIGEFLKSEELQRLVVDRTPIYMSGPEAVTSMQFYLRKFRGQEGTFRFFRSSDADRTASHFFGDRKLVPLPAVAASSSRQIWPPTARKQGFRLVIK